MPETRAHRTTANRIARNGIAAFDKHADEYDRWFDENNQIYRAEVNALQRLIPQTGSGVEVGLGTGRFSIPFGIRIGEHSVQWPVGILPHFQASFSPRVFSAPKQIPRPPQRQ